MGISITLTVVSTLLSLFNRRSRKNTETAIYITTYLNGILCELYPDPKWPLTDTVLLDKLHGMGVDRKQVQLLIENAFKQIGGTVAHDGTNRDMHLFKIGSLIANQLDNGKYSQRWYDLLLQLVYVKMKGK